MTTRKLLTCMLVLAVTLTACAYTATSEADQESVGFDSASHLSECTLGETCTATSEAECTAAKAECEYSKKSECSAEKLAECAAKKAECEASLSECTGEAVTDV